MKSPLAVLLVLLALATSGCGGLAKKMHEENAFLVSAEIIDVPALTEKCDRNTDAGKRECIATIAYDSRKKCKAFIDGLVLAENTTNTGFDMFTTLVSALATVLTPLSTVHGLTAAATISSGWKNSINSNIYAKASIANYQQAIMATYYKDMNDYAAALPGLSGDRLIVMNEAGRIVSIHAECSLAAAQASIAATLQGAATTPETGEELSTLTVAKATVGEGLQLRAVSSVFPNGFASVSYTVAAGDKEQKVADELSKKVNEDASFKAAKVTAAATTSPANSFLLHAPRSAHVQWMPSNPQALVVKPGAASSSTVEGGNKLGIPGKSLMAR